MTHKRKGFKRVFVVVLLATLLVASGMFVYWWQVNKRLVQDSEVILATLGKEVAENVRRTLDSQQKILTTLAVSLQDDTVLQDPEELITYLKEQNEQSAFDLTGFQFHDGRTFFSNGQEQFRFLPRETVNTVERDNFLISYQPKHPFVVGQPSLLLAAVVKSENQPWGVVFALQPTDSYQSSLQDRLLTDTSLSLVIDQRGDVLMSYPVASESNTFKVLDSAKSDKYFSKGKMYQNIQEGKDGIFGYVYDGVQRYLSYYPVGYNGWYAVAILPIVSSMDNIKSLLIKSTIISLCIVAMLVLLLTFILIQQHNNSKALYEMGFVDSLLKIDNMNAFRLKFPAAVEQWKSKQIPFALALININQFKAVNDMYGFEQGDEILKQVASALQATLQENELFCRIHADMFLSLLACPDREQLAQRIESMISRAGRCTIGEEILPLSLTCGIYVVEDNVPFYIMVDRANLAWASAKQNAGMRCAFYDSEYLRKLVTEKRIESTMEQALADHEFKLYLQPKCDFKTGRIVSAEALVRWQRTSEGMIRPDWFIPVFEKNGFVVVLDWYMLQQTLELLRKWLDEGEEMIPIGVNFSRLHLTDTSFIQQLERYADEAGVLHRYIEVELTESVVFGNMERIKQVIDGLHTSGFSVAMDDFGAGYSSLNVLKNLDFDCVKLDKEFLAKGEGNPRQRQVISGVVKMVKELGCRVVAEGVETQEQADFLSSIGCDVAQGYFYSRPLSVEEFEKKFKEQSKA